ncbi:conserved hypothetical protein [Histoplasma capsulatum H143]|uniref:Uncharacterized protein n=1 Tax=Ajellomyces capsulatus (strain H143) TaxID=544712 RepID=C6HAH3_AJECH|nr:conserved hypothetical protein [Histoplasma capsulatum H143]
MVEKPGFDDPRQDLVVFDFTDAPFGRRRDDPVAIKIKSVPQSVYFTSSTVGQDSGNAI